MRQICHSAYNVKFHENITMQNAFWGKIFSKKEFEQELQEKGSALL